MKRKENNRPKESGWLEEEGMLLSVWRYPKSSADDVFYKAQVLEFLAAAMVIPEGRRGIPMACRRW